MGVANLLKALSVLAIGEIMVLYSSHLILVVCMVDLFSDPDRICYLGDCAQIVSELVAHVYYRGGQGHKVYLLEDSEHRTRDDFVRAVREVVRGDIRGTTKKGVEIMMELCHDFPVIARG